MLPQTAPRFLLRWRYDRPERELSENRKTPFGSTKSRVTVQDGVTAGPNGVTLAGTCPFPVKQRERRHSAEHLAERAAAVRPKRPALRRSRHSQCNTEHDDCQQHHRAASLVPKENRRHNICRRSGAGQQAKCARRCNGLYSKKQRKQRPSAEHPAKQAAAYAQNASWLKCFHRFQKTAGVKAQC